MIKHKKTKKAKEEYEDVEDEKYLGCPQVKIDLNVLAEGKHFCLLKDDGNKNIYSVERSISDGKIYLNLLVEGN